tara:strand:- start:3508 stop:3708 length:201 start_codon:yes stop_codon:yes gene_type:complete
MKRTNKRNINLDDHPSLNLNKFSVGCAPCLSEASKVDRQINDRELSEIKINEIKAIVNSLFENKNN